MYCIVSYCVLGMYLICYLYTNVSTKVTRNKDIYNKKRTQGVSIRNQQFVILINRIGLNY